MPQDPGIALIGTLDTKGAEIGYVRDRLRALGARPLVVDSGILGEADGNEGNFGDGLWVQEVINAVEISHHERRWVSLPLDGHNTES